jgi:hypothetical protein
MVDKLEGIGKDERAGVGTRTHDSYAQAQKEADMLVKLREQVLKVAPENSIGKENPQPTEKLADTKVRPEVPKEGKPVADGKEAAKDVEAKPQLSEAAREKATNDAHRASGEMKGNSAQLQRFQKEGTVATQKLPEPNIQQPVKKPGPLAQPKTDVPMFQHLAGNEQDKTIGKAKHALHSMHVLSNGGKAVARPKVPTEKPAYTLAAQVQNFLGAKMCVKMPQVQAQARVRVSEPAKEGTTSKSEGKKGSGKGKSVHASAGAGVGRSGGIKQDGGSQVNVGIGAGGSDEAAGQTMIASVIEEVAYAMNGSQLELNFAASWQSGKILAHDIIKAESYPDESGEIDPMSEKPLSQRVADNKVGLQKNIMRGLTQRGSVYREDHIKA